MRASESWTLLNWGEAREKGAKERKREKRENETYGKKINKNKKKGGNKKTVRFKENIEMDYSSLPKMEKERRGTSNLRISISQKGPYISRKERMKKMRRGVGAPKGNALDEPLLSNENAGASAQKTQKIVEVPNGKDWPPPPPPMGNNKEEKEKEKGGGRAGGAVELSHVRDISGGFDPEYMPEEKDETWYAGYATEYSVGSTVWETEGEGGGGGGEMEGYLGHRVFSLPISVEEPGFQPPVPWMWGGGS